MPDDEGASPVKWYAPQPIFPTLTGTTPTVEVTGAKEALVVGPDDVLVVTLQGATVETMEWTRDQLRQAGLGPNQIILINGVEQLAKIRREPSS
jgi:hypothetical protein